MSKIRIVEFFPFTVERQGGEITETSNAEIEIVLDVYHAIIKIFNDNARIKSCK